MVQSVIQMQAQAWGRAEKFVLSLGVNKHPRLVCSKCAKIDNWRITLDIIPDGHKQ